MAIKRYIQVGEQFNNASLPQAQPHPLIPSLASLYAKPDGAYSTEYLIQQYSCLSLSASTKPVSRDFNAREQDVSSVLSAQAISVCNFLIHVSASLVQYSSYLKLLKKRLNLLLMQ